MKRIEHIQVIPDGNDGIYIVGMRVNELIQAHNARIDKEQTVKDECEHEEYRVRCIDFSEDTPIPESIENNYCPKCGKKLVQDEP